MKKRLIIELVIEVSSASRIQSIKADIEEKVRLLEEPVKVNIRYDEYEGN